MNRQCQASDMQIRKCKNITSKHPLNWIRLIQVGNMQGCYQLSNYQWHRDSCRCVPSITFSVKLGILMDVVNIKW